MAIENDYHVCIDTTGAKGDDAYAVWLCKYEDDLDDRNDHPGDMQFSFIVHTAPTRWEAMQYVDEHFPKAAIRFVREADRPGPRELHT